MKTTTKTVALLALLLLAMPAAGAKWTRAGLYGADVRAMALDPANPDRIYLGTSQGEVYRSDDGGMSWTNPRGANPFPGFVVDNLVVDSSSRVWAASWGLWGGGVVALSEDGGESWERRDDGIANLSVRAFTVFDSDPRLLFAGGLTGIFRSRDAGLSWERIADLPNVESIAVDPRDENRILAGTWRQAYRTVDGGGSWTLASDGMVLDTDIFTITIDRQDPDSVWLSTCGWVYHSTDGGGKWKRYRDGFDNRRIHDVKIDPLDRERILAGSVAGLYRTEDKGTSWSRISDDRLVINSIIVTAARPERILLGTEGDGVYRSIDGGKTFERTSDGLYNVRVAAVTPDPVEKGHLYAAVIFGNAASGIYHSVDGGEKWSQLSHDGMPEVLTLFVQEAGPARFIAGTERGFYSSADGVSWNESTILPLRVDKIVRYSGRRLFAATSEGVYTSRNGGESWYRLRGEGRRILDLELGTFGGETALYALHDEGLEIFDGRDWWKVREFPVGVRSIDFQKVDGVEGLVAFTGDRVQAGTAEGGIWKVLDPATELAARIRRASEIDRAIMMVSRSAASPFAGNGTWTYLRLPVPERSITSISSDPSEPSRLYIGTHGDGIFILEENGPATASGRP
jgi:photosystem II stability/assembly factor-like uncharacterized protein